MTSLRKLLLGALFLLLASAAYPAYKVGSAIYDAQVSERALEKCEFEMRQPLGTKVITLERAESGYICVFTDKQGRILGRARP